MSKPCQPLIHGIMHPPHIINSILVGDDPLNFDDWCFIEPQNDRKVNVGDWNMPEEDTHVSIANSPWCNLYGGNTVFASFNIKNGNPSLDACHQFLVLTRDTGIQEIVELTPNYFLEQNYPNPFNASSTIEYSLPRRLYVSLEVYNTLGQEIETLVNESQSAGSHKVCFDASGYSSGVYFYRLTSGDFGKSKKMLLVK